MTALVHLVRRGHTPTPHQAGGRRYGHGRGRGRGFSLMELCIVLGLSAVVAAITVPRYASASARYKANFAARRIMADLELAAVTARNASASRTVAFNDDGTYTIDETRDLDRGGDTYRVRLAEEPYGVKHVKASFGGDGVVVFDGYGAPDTDGTVEVEVGSVRRTVFLDPNGKASVQ